MTAILTTLMRGLLGVAATVVLVAVVWSVYANRAPLIAAGEFVVGVFSPREQSTPAAPSTDAGEAPAPTDGTGTPAPAAEPTR